MITNLVSNALKYGEGSPVDVRVAQEGPYARLEVCDRGIGIPPEQQARIFSKFERAVSSRNYGGFGLGLWIAHQIVELHGGPQRRRSGHLLLEPRARQSQQRRGEVLRRGLHAEAYSWSGDDSVMAACNAEDFDIVFCPEN